MPVRIDEARFEEFSRVAGVAIAAHMLRTIERWRANLGDYEAVMVMISVVAISAERLLRADLPAEYRSLSVPIDPALPARVNISSIAHAAGLNRETARRRVNELVAQGVLVRARDGSVSLPPGFSQSDQIRDQARAQLGEIVSVCNQLERMGVLVRDRRA